MKMKRLKRLWRRYNPRRTFIDLDEDTIIFMAQFGYIELYRGEWFLTDAGYEALDTAIAIAKEELMNDPR